FSSSWTLVLAVVLLLALECAEQADRCGVAGPGVARSRDPADSGGGQREAGVVDRFPSGPASLSPPGGTDQADPRPADEDVPGTGLVMAGCPDELVLALADDGAGDRRQGMFPLAADGLSRRADGIRCC